MTFRPGSDTPGAEPDADDSAGSPSSMNATERIIQRFGGIRPMANKLKTPVTTVQGWKKRGAIPLSRHADLRATALKLRIKLDEADLEAATPAEDRSATEAKAADGKAAPMKTPEEKPAAAKAPDSTSKTEPAKTDAPKPAETKPAEVKPVSVAETPKPGEAPKPVPAEVKPAAPTSVADTPKTVVTPPPAAAGAKPADAKPAEVKPVSVAETPKPGEPAKPTPAEVKPAAPTSVADTPKPAAGPATAGKPADVKPSAPPAGTKPATAAAAPSKTETPKAEPPKTDRPAGGSQSTYTPAPVVVEQRTGGAGFATVVSLLALIVGAAALSEPFWGPKVPGWPHAGPVAPPPPADPALRAQIQQLTDRVAKLEQRPAAAPAGDATALTARLDAVEKKLAAQPAAPAPVAAAPSAPGASFDTAQTAALGSRLAALEQRPAVDPAQVAAAAQTAGQAAKAAGDAAKAADQAQQDITGVKGEVSALADTVQKIANAQAQAQSLVLAAGQLAGAIATGQPFEAELKTARAVAGSDGAVVSALDTLAPLAGRGVATRAQLADRFGPLADEIVKADLKGNGATWVDQVTGTLSTLVTVRRQGGGIVGDTAEAITARAEAAVHQGNLAGAVTELSALTGPAAQAAAGWLADARARLAAEAAGTTLTDRSIALLNAAAKGQAVAQ
ncbi:hypothetical protein M2352_000756 [Azospirillum fermentarium]|uniref:COG4223 family protein n=1 Tax=Azospirillum fermentarium TaxID=1233114 RepID=UPI002227104F|nr:mitofilin family membrane protein [Azospirillum fermentarium]MCW2245165.1 hypothetical protein [Azospirillum fermentarium]